MDAKNPCKYSRSQKPSVSTFNMKQEKISHIDNFYLGIPFLKAECSFILPRSLCTVQMYTNTLFVREGLTTCCNTLQSCSAKHYRSHTTY